MKLLLRLFIFAGLVPASLQAQTFSSYSGLGIGDISSKALVQHRSMGILGISNSSVYFQNTLNPALLPENAVYSFTGGFTYETNRIIQGDNLAVASGGTLSYLNMVLPLKQNIFTASIGLFPYSNVDYSYIIETPVQENPDATVTALNTGEGGFNQFVFASGIKIAKHLYLGAEIAYVFSSITKEKSVAMTDPVGPYVPSSRTRLTAGDFVGGVGLAYRQPISDDIAFSVGATYDFSTELSVTKFQTLALESITGTPIKIDTLLDNIGGFIHLPESFGIGVSVKRLNGWTFGVDVNLGNWSEFRDFDGQNSNMTNSLSFAIGGEIIPNISSVNNYFERIAYRIGINYEETPYLINDTHIDEIGINFGFSLPVSNFSSIDLGFQYGTQGTLDNNLIKEEFFRFYFGFTFNDNRWFVRPKFN